MSGVAPGPGPAFAEPAPAPPKNRGRLRQGEEGPKALTVIERQVDQSVSAIPLMRLTGERVTYRYDLADAAYCSEVIRAVFRQEGHLPLIDHNARRGERSPLRRTRPSATRPAARRSGYARLMFGILVIAAEQLWRLLR